MPQRFVMGYKERPWLYCSDQCVVDHARSIGGSKAWRDAIADEYQFKLWCDCAADDGCLMCQKPIPSPIPANAVYILADLESQTDRYLGFGCQFVETVGKCRIVACPRDGVEWMAQRLASGMHLMHPVYERFYAIEDARVAARQW